MFGVFSSCACHRKDKTFQVFIQNYGVGRLLLHRNNTAIEGHRYKILCPKSSALCLPRYAILTVGRSEYIKLLELAYLLYGTKSFLRSLAS